MQGERLCGVAPMRKIKSRTCGGKGTTFVQGEGLCQSVSACKTGLLLRQVKSAIIDRMSQSRFPSNQILWSTPSALAECDRGDVYGGQ